MNPLRGAGQRLQGRGSGAITRGAEDACTQPPSAGVRNRVSHAGGARGRAAVPVLQDRAPAGGGVAGREEALARTLRHRSARRCTSPRAGTAMTGPWGFLPALAWCASTCRGVLRASGIAAAHKLVAALAIDGAKWGLTCSRASTLQSRLAASQISPP